MVDNKEKMRTMVNKLLDFFFLLLEDGFPTSNQPKKEK